MANDAVSMRERDQEQGIQPPLSADRRSLRTAAALLAFGFVFSVLVGLLHPGREDPNSHAAVFAEYASSPSWTAVHLGQFVGFGILIAGLFFLYQALRVEPGMPGWAGRSAAAAALVTLALYGMLQAVDGVALKRAVDAWVSAPAAEKTARMATAEGIRWLEEGARSYQDIMLGLTFILFGIEIARTARIPRPIGYLLALTGIFYIAQGWIVGMQGFAPTHGLAQLPAYVFLLASIIWLLISAWRMKEPGYPG